MIDSKNSSFVQIYARMAKGLRLASVGLCLGSISRNGTDSAIFAKG